MLGTRLCWHLKAVPSLRAAGASDIQDFPRPQPQPPLGTPFTVGADAFLALSRFNLGADDGFWSSGSFLGVAYQRRRLISPDRPNRARRRTCMWTSDRVFPLTA